MIELKTVVKWVLAPLVAKRLNCSSNLNEDFSILLQFSNEADDEQLVASSDRKFDPFREAIEQKMNYSNAMKKRRNNGDKISKKVGLTHHTMKIVGEKPQLVMKLLGTGALPLKAESTFSCTFESKNIYIGGHYLKFSRGLSQTPWEIEGQRLYETSLQEELAKEILPFFGPSDYKFHSGVGSSESRVAKTSTCGCSGRAGRSSCSWSTRRSACRSLTIS